MARRLIGLVVLAAVACAGCGDGNAGSAGSGSSTSTVSSAPSGEPSTAGPVAKRALRGAVRKLLRANTGHVEVSVPVGAGPARGESTDYQLRPTRASSQCSANVASTVSSDPTPEPPAAVVAARYGVGVAIIDESTIDGTTDLALVLRLLGGGVGPSSDLSLLRDSTVPVTFSVDDGVLRGFRIERTDVMDAVAAADDGLSDGPAPLDLAGDVTVTFTDVGRVRGTCG